MSQVFSKKRLFSFWAVSFLGWVVCSPSGWCHGDLDRQFRLETLGYLRPLDNLDGVFAESITSAFEKFFGQQNRFVLTDLRAVDSVVTRSKLPYEKVIYDAQILKQVSVTTGTESFIRTRVQKVGANYDFKLEWLHAPKMEILAEVHFVLEEPKNGASFDGEFLGEKLKEQLSKLVHGLPFYGSVTGRVQESVTLNIGDGDGVKAGDRVELATIDEVKVHPLMNRVVSWKLRPVGTLLVEKVDGGMAFCHLLSEEPGLEVSRFQKVTRIEKAPSPVVQEAVGVVPEGVRTHAVEATQPRLGWMSVGLPLGSYSRLTTANNGALSNRGGGLALGAQVETEVLLNGNWFFGFKLAYLSWDFLQRDRLGFQTQASLAGGVPGSDVSYGLNFGYRVDFSGEMAGGKGWLKLGFKSAQTGLPSSVLENTGKLTLSSIVVGAGGSYPFLTQWTALVDLKLRLMSFASLNGKSASGNADFNIVMGANYQLSPRMTIRAAMEYQVISVVSAGGTSVDQNLVTIAPALLYQF